MRTWIAPAAIVCGLAACSSSGSKAVSPGMARFVGTWEGAAGDVMLVVQGDQKATLTLRTGNAEPRVLKGTCFPGSDTLSFAQEWGNKGKTGPGQSNYLFSTRPDGTLVVAIEGASVGLTRR